jgi:hypothetical protein
LTVAGHRQPAVLTHRLQDSSVVTQGPYYLYSHTEKRRSYSQRIPADAAEQYRTETENCRRFKELAQQYILVCESLTEQGAKGKKLQAAFASEIIAEVEAFTGEGAIKGDPAVFLLSIKGDVALQALLLLPCGPEVRHRNGDHSPRLQGTTGTRRVCGLVEPSEIRIPGESIGHGFQLRALTWSTLISLGFLLVEPM